MFMTGILNKNCMKRSWYFLTAAILIFGAINGYSQDTRLKYFGVESGMNFTMSEMSDMDAIRGDIPNYSMGYSASNLTSLSYTWYAGVRSEIFSLNDRFGLQSGLRFSQICNTIGKDEYWGGSTNYFYWLYRQEGTETEFLKIKEIRQNTGYLGIPVELRYFVSRRPRLFQLYGKLGAVVDFRVSTRTRVEFKDPAMEIFEKNISDQVDQPGPVSFAMYAGSGFKIGTDQKPSVSVEACFPFFILTAKSSGMLRPLFGGGFQLTFQVPIKPRVK
jgi:hypothetical protein